MYPATNYNYFTQQQPTIPQVAFLKGRPVASFEEARAMSIDFDGSTFFFPDLANKRIYTKQINLDGTATLNMYELKEMPVEEDCAAKSFITREEFEKVIAEIKGVITKQPSTPVTPQNSPDLSKLF